MNTYTNKTMRVVLNKLVSFVIITTFLFSLVPAQPLMAGQNLRPVERAEADTAATGDMKNELGGSGATQSDAAGQELYQLTGVQGLDRQGIFQNVSKEDMVVLVASIKRLKKTFSEKGIDPSTTLQYGIPAVVEISETPKQFQQAMALANRLVKKGINPISTFGYGIPEAAEASKTPEEFNNSLLRLENLIKRLNEAGYLSLVDKNVVKNALACNSYKLVHHPAGRICEKEGRYEDLFEGDGLPEYVWVEPRYTEVPPWIEVVPVEEEAMGREMRAASDTEKLSEAGANGDTPYIASEAASTEETIKVDVSKYNEQLKQAFRSAGTHAGKTIAESLRGMPEEELFEIFPFLRELNITDKKFSGGEGTFFTHTLAVMYYLEKMLRANADDGDSDIFRKGNQTFPHNGTYAGEEAEFGEWKQYSVMLKDLLKNEDYKEFFFLFALLHDIGGYIDETNHDTAGEPLAEAVLRQLGFEENKIERMKWLVKNHTALGVIITGERTPKYLLDRLEDGIPETISGAEKEEEVKSRLVMLMLLAICDVRSMADGSYMIKKALDYYNYLGAKDRLGKCQENFHVYRLAVFESKANRGYVGSSFPEGSVLGGEYNKLENDDKTAFTENFRELIERFDYAIRTIWEFKDKDKKTLWKFLFLVQRVVQEAKQLNIPGIKTARVSFPPESDFGNDKERIKGAIAELSNIFRDKDTKDIIRMAKGVDMRALISARKIFLNISGIPVEIDLAEPSNLKVLFRINELGISEIKSNAIDEAALVIGEPDARIMAELYTKFKTDEVLHAKNAVEAQEVINECEAKKIRIVAVINSTNQNLAGQISTTIGQPAILNLKGEDDIEAVLQAVRDL